MGGGGGVRGGRENGKESGMIRWTKEHRDSVARVQGVFRRRVALDKIAVRRLLLGDPLGLLV